MFPPGLLPHRIAIEVFGAHAELCGNEAKDVQGNGLPHRQNPTRISKGAKLEHEAQPVVSPAPHPNMLDVVVGQRVMAQQGGFIRGQIKQAGPLARAPDASSRHVPPLRYSVHTGRRGVVRKGIVQRTASLSPRPTPDRDHERLI